MNLRILSTALDSCLFRSAGLPISVTGSHHQKRFRRYPHSEPIFRLPYWRVQQERAPYDEMLTKENEEFLAKYVAEGNFMNDKSRGCSSPLKVEPLKKGEWYPECTRTGLIAVKLGFIPQWLKNGQRIITTLMQVVDNQVVKYIPSTERDIRPLSKKYRAWTKGMGNLVVGAINGDPQKMTRAYCGLFDGSGVSPKKILTKFPVNDEAVIQPGTPLYAAHFRVGDYVDVSGITIYRGFQGVMKRWGFHGMPASHGQTKTHRRPGNIGGGGEKGRVWPGKKMPGHKGNKLRTVCGLRILRINHKYNVLYVTGFVPGDINSILYVHDCHLENKRPKEAPPFPTYYPEDEKEPLPEEEWHESLFNFNDPTITYTPEKVLKSKK